MQAGSREQKEVTASDLVRQEGNRGWLAMHAEEDAGRVLEKLQKM